MLPGDGRVLRGGAHLAGGLFLRRRTGCRASASPQCAEQADGDAPTGYRGVARQYSQFSKGAGGDAGVEQPRRDGGCRLYGDGSEDYDKGTAGTCLYALWSQGGFYRLAAGSLLLWWG